MGEIERESWLSDDTLVKQVWHIEHAVFTILSTPHAQDPVEVRTKLVLADDSIELVGGRTRVELLQNADIVLNKVTLQLCSISIGHDVISCTIDLLKGGRVLSGEGVTIAIGAVVNLYVEPGGASVPDDA